MNPTVTEDGIVSPPCDNQKMPPWNAFNSLATIEHIDEHSVGLLHVVPHPATDYASVFPAKDNVLDMLTQLAETRLTQNYDDGV